MKSTAIILAAGMGTRMKSKLPKVMHSVCGKPMIEWILEVVKDSGIERTITVLGHGVEVVADFIGDKSEIVYQQKQLGTGHAVMQGAELLQSEDGVVVVLCGDTPLLTKESMEKMILLHKKSKSAVTVMTAFNENPHGYGRIVRDSDGIKAIVEEKDATDDVRKICEVNAGTYCFDQRFLLEGITKLDNNNAQEEYYLTDLIKIAVDSGYKVAGFKVDDFLETMGVNNRVQLAQAQMVMQKRILNKLMLSGVSILDTNSTYIESDVQIGMDSVILPNCMIKGNTVIGQDCVIGPDCEISNSVIGDECNIKKAVVVDSTLANACTVGPFAYIRPKCQIADNAKIGHFVEVKNTVVGKGSKVPHLSYMGDSEIGSGVNIGCGSITCNYDGVNKYKTIIEDDVFVGSNSNLVAPVKVQKGAFIAAGSTITKDVAQNSLAIARAEQSVKVDWVLKKKAKEEK